MGRVEAQIQAKVPHAAAHALQTDEEHAQCQHHESEPHGPEMQLTQLLVVHAAGQLREPIVKGRKEGEDVPPKHRVMEMADYEVGIVQMQVGSDGTQGWAGNATQQENDDSAEHK